MAVPGIGNVLTQVVSRVGLSSLVAWLVQVVQHDSPVTVLLSGCISPPEISTQGLVSEATEQACGRPGHGVSQCSWVDTLFPLLPPGWLVAFRDG